MSGDGKPEDSGAPDPLTELDEIIAEYIRADEAGEAPDRGEFLSRCERFRTELERFFADRDRMEELAGPLRREALPPPLYGTIRYFGDYELIEEIARGGMGVVYRAHHESLHRTVALKMITAGRFASRSDVERFRIEAKAAAKLDHPGIVPIYEVGEHDGQQYFSMKLVEGESLAERLGRERLRPEETARLLAAVARAVQHAHEHGVLHRDLKPANILLDSGADPYVSDFGLAKSLDAESSLTRSGAVVGTPGYMAPEQAGGRSRDVTMATDVWGLGAILYHALTGRPPFQSGRSLETLRLVCDEEPPRPRLLNVKVPRDLETICLKCLEKQPARRYASAGALAEDLESFRGGRPITARRVTPWERAVKWAYRKPAKAGLVAVSLVATVLLASALAVNRITSEALHERTTALELLREQEKATQTALASRTEALELLRTEEAKAREALRSRTEALALLHEEEERTDAALASRTESLESLEEVRRREKRTAYFDRIVFAERVRALGHVDEANAILDECSPEQRGWEWGYLKGLYTKWDHWKTLSGDGPVQKEPITTSLRAYDVKFSPDGRLVATSYGIWDVVTGKTVLELPLLAKRRNIGRRGRLGVAFSPDGRFLACSDASGETYRHGAAVEILEVNSGRKVLRLPGHEKFICTVAFSPDGRLLASAGGDDTVRVWDLETTCEVHTLRGADTNPKWFSTVFFSPDGKRLAAGYGTGSVWIWDVQNGEPLHVFKVHGGGRCIAFSSDGAMIAGSGAAGVTVWDVETGDELASRPGKAYTLAFSPGGVLAISGTNGVSRGPAAALTLWEPVSGRDLLTLVGETAGTDAMAFSPEGRRLALAGSTLRIMESALPLDFAFEEAYIGLRPGLVADSNSVAAPGHVADDRDVWNVPETDDVLPLPERRRLQSLFEETDQLWPVHPRAAPALKKWLETAGRLAAELDRADAPWKAVRARQSKERELLWKRRGSLEATLAREKTRETGDTAIGTLISFGDDPDNKPTACYFRHTFEVSDLAGLGELRARLLVDDGAVIYLNGEEIGRVNMPQGQIGRSTKAKSTVDTATDFVLIRPGTLRVGRNVLAVEVHQASPSSSDILFALEYVADAGVLVDRQAAWRYAEYGRDVGATWTDLDYDDASWSSGPAPLGYGFKTGPLRLVELQRSIEELDRELGTTRLIEKIETFLLPATGTIATVAARLERTTVLSKLSLDDHREEWDEAIRSIAASPRYGGLRLRPQFGLVPLGPDPRSGLWEFAHLESGKPPRRDALGRLRMTEETGIVFVLIPGGTLVMGTDCDPESPDEGPAREIRLGAFFLSKFEMTQAQWERVTDGNPSRFVSPRHPVEQVSWTSCERALWRLGLVLPTEAQWEYAARGGTTTPWWTGGVKTSLEGAANLGDSTLRRLGVSPEFPCEEAHYDGHGPHAPVGSFRADAFGLHDVAGNVWEWCLDGYGSYELPLCEMTGERVVENPTHRVHRGGSWMTTARACRSAARMKVSADFRHLDLGVRPARRLE